MRGRSVVLLFVLFGVFACALGFYVLHLAPTTTWGDSAGHHHAMDKPLSVGARGYPLFVLLERAFRAFPTDDPWYNANLLTAVLGALALVAIFAVIRRLTSGITAAVAGTIAFGVAHSVWSYSVVTEVYTLNWLIIALMLLLLLRFRDGDPYALPLLLFVAGIGLGHHRLLGFMALPFFVFVGLHRRRLTRRMIVLGAVALLVGALPTLILFVRELSGGVGFGELLHFYLTGGISKSLFNLDPGIYAKSTGLFLAYLALNLLGAALPLALLGGAVLARRDRGVFALLALTFALYAGFAIGYRHHGIWVAYTTHAYLPLAILVGVGTEAFLNRFVASRRTMAFVTLALLFAVPFVAYRSSPAVLRALDLRPFAVVDADRFHRWYLDPDQSRDRTAYETAVAILDRVPPDAHVLGDWGIVAVLRLVQHHEGRNPEVGLHLAEGRRLTTWLDEVGDSRPVYLTHFIHYPPVLRASGYRLRAVEDGLPLYRILPEEAPR